ncbi:MAG: molybdenum cofactor biosynthesis protein MoaE [Alteripontixanthobacter sp.]
MTIDCILTGDPFDAEARLREFLVSSNGAGAIASFTGIARSASKDGSAVKGLFLDHHARLTAKSMDAIVNAAMDRFAITGLLAIHRFGWVPAGDPIVLVAAASSHRRAALQAVDYTMDRLKTDAVFWKREDTGNGSHWIEPTSADYQDTKRWERKP